METQRLMESNVRKSCSLESGIHIIILSNRKDNFRDQAAIPAAPPAWGFWFSSSLLPSSVFLRPSAPITTSKSKSATGWPGGRTSARHPGPKGQSNLMFFTGGLYQRTPLIDLLFAINAYFVSVEISVYSCDMLV